MATLAKKLTNLFEVLGPRSSTLASNLLPPKSDRTESIYICHLLTNSEFQNGDLRAKNPARNPG
jgi:hypothetical protein